MNRTHKKQTLISLFTLASLLILSSCVDTRHTIRQVDQHHGGDFNTVETSGERTISVPPFYTQTEYLGINFWNCLQSNDLLDCERVCDDQWDRICAPELKNEFGTVSKPGAGVVMARARARQAQPAVAEEESSQTDEETSPIGDAIEEEIEDEVQEEMSATEEDEVAAEDEASEENNEDEVSQ